MAGEWFALLRLSLVFSVACMVVLLLRLPVRRACGARVAYVLWWLPVAMLLAALLPPGLLPGAATPGFAALPIEVVANEAGRSAVFGWAQACLALWGLGAASALFVHWRAQRRFLRALGPLQAQWRGRLRVHRAHSQAGLPALVGLWRPRLVLPLDFEVRYDHGQRALLLRHELVHRHRGDPWANALAALLHACQWFNPLAGFALRAFRHDQELACDAVVLARRPRQRTRYAEALLRSAMQASSPSAVLVCAWGALRPLKERIRMLHAPAPARSRRLLAAPLVGAVLCVGTCVAGGAQPRPADAPPAPLDRHPMAGQGAFTPPPRYPRDAYAKRITGSVTLLLEVRADGSVADVRVERSQPHGVFDAAALETARRWRFEPQQLQGRPAATRLRVPVTFEIKRPASSLGDGATS